MCGQQQRRSRGSHQSPGLLSMTLRGGRSFLPIMPPSPPPPCPLQGAPPPPPPPDCQPPSLRALTVTEGRPGATSVLTLKTALATCLDMLAIAMMVCVSGRWMSAAEHQGCVVLLLCVLVCNSTQLRRVLRM